MSDSKGKREIPNNTISRSTQLYERIEGRLKESPVELEWQDGALVISINDMEVCTLSVYEEYYLIVFSSAEWTENTTYHCESADNGEFQYAVSSLDECIGEIDRLVNFVVSKSQSLFQQQLKRYGLDKTNTWGPELRSKIVSMFDPILENTNYKLRTESNDNRYIDLVMQGDSYSTIRFRTRPRTRDMQVVFNGDSYELVNKKIGLPANVRPYKPKTPYIHCNLEKTWNIVCALVEKTNLYVD